MIENNTVAENIVLKTTGSDTEKGEAMQPIVENSAEQPSSEVSNNKKFKLIAIAVIAVVVAVAIAAGIFVAILFNVQKNTNDVEIVEKASVLMFVSDTEDTNIGNLYYQTEDGEKIQIGKNVLNKHFVLMPQTQIVYYQDKDNVLYMCEPEKESEKLTDNANFYSLSFSDDEKIVIFSSYTEEKSALYRKELDGEKEKICSELGYCSPYLSPDGSKVYYCDTDEDLYVWTAETDEDEKLAANISYFVADNNAYAYDIYNEENETCHTYLKLANDAESYRLDNTTLIQLCQDGHAMICLRDSYYTESEQALVGDLYLYYAGVNEGTRLATDVCDSFQVSKDGKIVYYTDTDGNFYKKELPEITEKSTQNQEKLKKQIDNSEKIKLAGNISSFSVSPNGKNAICLDDDNNMYVCVEGQEKVKVGTDIDTMYIFDDRIAFLTNDGNFYVNNNYIKTKNIKEENVLVAESVESISATDYGQNIFYCLETNRIMLLKKGTETKEIIKDAQKFDRVLHNVDYIYEKLLSMKDLAGYYSIDAKECLLKISVDGSVEYYLIGEPVYAYVDMVYSIDKYSSTVLFNETDYYTFSVDENKTKTLKNHNNTNYVLKEITIEDFKTEIDKQKKAEEARIAEEKHKEELKQKRDEQEEKGNYYYRNGYYVSTSDTLYSYPDSSSATDRKYTASSTKSVYGYSVSEDGEKLWLKVRATDDEGYSSYLWVLAK